MAKTEIISYKLNGGDIDLISNKVNDWMKAQKTPKLDMIRIRFMMESILLDMADHFGDDKDVEVVLRKRWGRPSFSVNCKGEEFNPIHDDESSILTRNLMAFMGMTPKWKYNNGVNEIVLETPHNIAKGENLMIAAVILSVILGLLKNVLPAGMVSFLSEYILSTFDTVFMNLMGVFAGVMIFLSVLAGVCGMGSVADFSKMGKYLLFRTMALSFIVSGIFAVLMIPFFNFHYGQSASEAMGKEVFKMIMDIIPSDPITPFQEGNTLQIVFISIIVGVVFIMTGDKTEGLRQMVFQANDIALNVIEVVCKLLPLYILASLTMLFWDNGFGILLNVWKPFLIFVITCVLTCFLVVAYISIKYKVKMSVLIKKIMPTFIIGITTASSTATTGTQLEINEKKLGVAPEYSKFAVPLKNIICMSVACAGFINMMYYLADYSEVSVNIGWFVTVWLIVNLLTPAMPPVSGGPLIVIGLMLTEFGIPSSCLGLAATITIVYDFFMTAFRLIISHMEVVDEAAHFELLDYDILRKE